jgi:hypothetical protein
MSRVSAKVLALNLTAVSLMLALAGCNGGADSAAALALQGGPGPKPKEERVLQSDLTGFCPQVVLREGTAFFTTYEKGGEGDQARAIYQASISTVTRSCKRENGNVVMTVAAAGKVVPGPKANGSTISLPIRVAISEGGNVLYSQLQQFQVTITAGQAATQFVFNDPNAAVPEAQVRAVQVFVGFDEGPPKPKKAEG